MTKKTRTPVVLLGVIGAFALVLTAAPISISFAPDDSFLTLNSASAGQPKSGQPGNTEGGSGGPSPGQKGGGGNGSQHNNGK